MGRYEHAIEDYDDAIDLYFDQHERSPESHAGLALAYLAIDEFGHATDEFREADSLGYGGREFYQRAIEAFTGSIEESDKPHYALHKDRGYFYGKVGEFELAIADLNRAIEIDPDNAQIYYEVGIIHEALGNDDQAIDAYTEAIEFSENIEWSWRYIQSYLNRGNIYYRRALAEAIAIGGSRLPWIVPGLASEDIKLGDDLDDALDDFESAYELDERNVEGLCFLQETPYVVGRI